MRFNIRALLLASGLIWGGAVMLTDLANLVWPNYGVAFLAFVASIYPGYHPGSGIGSVVTGALYGFVDGAVCGAIFGWLYNLLAGSPPGKTG